MALYLPLTRIMMITNQITANMSLPKEDLQLITSDDGNSNDFFSFAIPQICYIPTKTVQILFAFRFLISKPPEALLSILAVHKLWQSSLANSLCQFELMIVHFSLGHPHMA
uniref:Uncharacterized protein n=1 Tax=Wuchereria bancrofti TaxID=6293 RepID=A0AAF5PTX6_WUCBA